MTRSLFTEEYRLFLKLLRQARKDTKTKQKELSLKLNYSPNYINKCEKGDRRLDLIEYMHIMRKLKLDPCIIVRKLDEFLNKKEN